MLNVISCSTDGGNTGYGTCFLDPKNIIGGFNVPKSFELTTEDLASSDAIIAKLTEGTLLIASQRVYPLPRFENFTNNTEEATLQTLGFGGIYKTREGRYNWLKQFVEGGLCLSNAMRKFNGKKNYIIFFDSEGLLIGQKVGTSIKGIPQDLMDTKPFGLNDGANIAVYATQFMFAARYINENIGFAEADVAGLSDIMGLQNIALTKFSRATNIIKVTARYGCDGASVYDLYSTELAEITAWVAKNTSGGIIEITSVAVDAVNSAWTITVDTTDPNYTAGQPITISLAAPTVLAEAPIGVSGFESNSISVTV